MSNQWMLYRISVVSRTGRLLCKSHDKGNKASKGEKERKKMSDIKMMVRKASRRPIFLTEVIILAVQPAHKIGEGEVSGGEEGGGGLIDDGGEEGRLGLH